MLEHVSIQFPRNELKGSRVSNSVLSIPGTTVHTAPVASRASCQGAFSSRGHTALVHGQSDRQTDSSLDTQDDPAPSLLHAGAHACALASSLPNRSRVCVLLASLGASLPGCPAQPSASAGSRGSAVPTLTLEKAFACLPVFRVAEGWVCCCAPCLHPVQFVTHK